MTEESIHQETMDLYASNKRAIKYVKQKLIELKKNTKIHNLVKDLNIHFSTIVRMTI